MNPDELKASQSSESLSLSSSSSSEAEKAKTPPPPVPTNAMLPPRPSEAGDKKPPPASAPANLMLPPRPSEAGDKKPPPSTVPANSLLPSHSSEAGERKSPPRSAASNSLLPPRSPKRPAVPISPKRPAAPTTTTARSREEEIIFYPKDKTKIDQDKNNPNIKSDTHQPQNLLNTIDHQHITKPPSVIRGKSSGTAASAISALLTNEGASHPDYKIPENEQHQSLSPQRQPGHHARRVSWGGKLIQIPQIFNDKSIPPLFPEGPQDLVDSDNNGEESQEATRTKLASALVSNIEAKMRDEGIDVSAIIETKYQDYRPDGSFPAIDKEDLAKMHPVESQAAFGVLEDIESEDREHKDDQLQENEQIEAVASLFNTASDTLLDKVPKGAEDMFQKVGSIPSPPSVTDNSITSQPSETMAAGSDQSPTREGRSRINSVSQVSMASATSKSRRSLVGHNRTNTMTSFRTNLSSPKPQRGHRRQQTMEQRLLSLNQALDAMDAPAPSQQKDQDTDIEQQGDAAKHYHEPTTSLDLFNQNLALLFQDFDGNRGGDHDENEMTPLAQNRVEANAHPLDANNISTSSTDSSIGQKENEPEIEDASLDNFVNPAEQTNAGDINQRKSWVAEAHPTSGEDIEAGTSNASNKEYMSASTHETKKKLSKFRQLLKNIFSVQNMESFFKSRTPAMLRYLKNLCYLILAATIFAAIMYYGLGNPPLEYDDEFELEEFDDDEILANQTTTRTCRYYVSEDNNETSKDTRGASYSWWTLYLFVRLPITFTMAMFLEIFFIDFIILEWRWLGSCIGATFTLLIVQAKGWPAILFFWSLVNLIMLYGKSPFVQNWGYWQGIELFNNCNESGVIIASETNLKVQLLALAVSVAVAVKRLLIGFYQGRKTFLHYSAELSKLMTKILLLSEISNLSFNLEADDEGSEDMSDDGSIHTDGRLKHTYKSKRCTGIQSATELLKQSIAKEDISTDGSQGASSLRSSSTVKTRSNKQPFNDRQKELVSGLISQSQKRRIERLLGGWEEPEKQKFLTDHISIGAILQFRKSLSKLDSEFPFSWTFGKADTRDDCIHSSQDLYFRILDNTPDAKLQFNLLGLIALQPDGTLDEEKLKKLIKVFQPDRFGEISLVDFVKSTDTVYKEMKLLRASIRNSQKIDKSFEKIFNILFYFIITCIVLSVLGFDPIAVFLSLSSVVLAFSFMISAASSKYVEGLLFVLYRRPYDIGDMIAIQSVEDTTGWSGSTHWIVRDIDLYTTTIIYSFTGELATVSNGSIANSRVMNGARSLPAKILFSLRFGIETSLEKIDIFREALVQYVEKRPREWVKLLAIRNLQVQSDEGYVEYLICLQHVCNWQHLGTIKTSRSAIKFFCNEVAKELGITFKHPPMPIDLNVVTPLDPTGKRPLGNLESVEESNMEKLSDEKDRLYQMIRNSRM